MSMIANFRSLSDDDLGALLENPARVEQLLYGDDTFSGTNGEVVSLFGDRSQTPERGGLVGARRRRRRARRRQGLARDPLPPHRHGLGGQLPLNFIVSGGKEIGDVDVGYGPARALMSEDVRRLDAELEPLTSEEMKRRFDPEQMTRLQIYPEIWDRDPDDDDSLGYLIEYYTDLRDFVRRTAERGHGLLIYLN
jgi:Domain of unknown function (DUF1877)